MSDLIHDSRPIRFAPWSWPSRLQFDGLVPLAVPAALIVLWQVASSLGYISQDFLPTPVDVIAAGWRLTVSGELPANIAVSFRRAISGFLLGAHWRLLSAWPTAFRAGRRF